MRNRAYSMRVAAVMVAGICLLPQAYGAPDFYVTTNGTGSGASWALATSFTNALTTATADQVIWMEQGTYTSTSTFTIATSGLEIYGGFDGTETNLNERDWTNQLVLLDGEMTRRVLSVGADDVLLDGLVVTNGYDDDLGGAGLRINGNTGLTMLNCLLVGNHQNGNDRRGGGAYFLSAGNVLVSNCVFRGNFTTLRTRGLGFYSQGTDLTVLDSEIRENIHQSGDYRYGAGFNLDGGTLIMRNTIVADNDTKSNDSNAHGGGGYISGATASFTNCIFTGNKCGRSDGGALFVNSGSTTIDNCTFANNSGFAGNSDSTGGAIYLSSASVTIKDSIFWNNKAGTSPSAGHTIYQSAGTLNISYSCFDGIELPQMRFVSGTWGDGIITNNPLFASEYTDVHLQSKIGRWDGTNWVTDASNSPCIDAGDPANDYSNEPAGEDGARINMGAYGNTWQASKSTNEAPTVVTQTPRVVATAAEIKGVLSSGAVSTVTFYYGVSDPGPTATGWDATNALADAQSVGNVFSSVAGGLQASQTYWFRTYATNAFGEDWSDAASFSTGTAAPGGGAGVIHVDTDAVGVPDGLSWTNAFTAFEDALAGADSGLGSNVWVAEGSYLAQGPYLIRTNGLSVYGGFDGTETLLTQRDWTNNIALLNGGGTRRVIDLQADDVLLDGLIITNGYTISTHGVGVRATSCTNLTILNCLITENTQQLSDGRGAGAYFENAGNVLVSNTLFLANRTYQRAYGLGFYSLNTTLTLVDCEIRESNHTGDARRGAGFFMSGGTLSMLRTTVADNDTNASDGDGSGGGGYVNSGTASFTNCIFTGNDSGSSDGAGLYINSGNVTIESCTFAGNAGNTNSSSHEGGAIYVNNATVTLRNSILWGNDAGNDGNDGDTIYQNAGTLSIGYSCLEGTNSPHLVSSGTLNWDDGIIVSNPLFVVEYSDVHLQSKGGHWNGSAWVTDSETSPCLNAGDPTSDFSLEPQSNGKRINMGAYGNTAEASKTAVPGTILIIR